MTAKKKPVENKPTGLSRADNPAVAADPPAASDIPLRGQIETNQDAPGKEQTAENENRDPSNQAAYDFGRRAALARGRDRSSPLEFELHEPQLQQEWSAQQDGSKISWQQARQAAHEAWNKVQAAISGGQDVGEREA
jgi:hypothetical protein